MEPMDDYYNAGHTNIHGALKLTHYLSDYIYRNYDPCGIDNDPINASWDEDYQKYMDIIEPYLSNKEIRIINGQGQKEAN